jgi:predicted transporter
MMKTGVALLTVAMLASATPVLACPVCFGAVDSQQMRGMQAGILALLGVTVAILGSFAGFFFIYLRRRMRRFEESSGSVQQGAHEGSY